MEDFLKKIKKGQHLKPGDDHYRAYVGPPKDYDLIGAMVFNLLTCFWIKAIKFFHPRQQWVVFYKDKNVSEFLNKEDISWNNRLNFKG